MNSDRQPSVLIIGSGAMAGLFAARLSRAGVRVQMLVTWPEALDALRQHGVGLVEADSVERYYPVQAETDPACCEGSELALVLVKTWQTQRAAQQLAQCLTADGLALTLQNGLGNVETLAGVLGAERVALGVTTLGVSQVGPGRVRLAGDGPVVLHCPDEDTPAAKRLEQMAQALQEAGFHTEFTEDARSLQWGKLVINAAINPLSALLGVPNGQLLERPTARAVLQAAAREAAAVAAAQGISLPYPDPVAAAEEVARRTAANTSSMLKDVQRGSRRTEIDAISGAIVQHGERLGVATPVNQLLWQLVTAKSG